jgi:shikimate kinase
MGTLWLVGLMGSGKSTVGPLVAARLGLPFIDLDAEVASAAGRSVAEVFAAEGEAGFRRREAAALATVAGKAAVWAC